ncbi:MAG: universal stress protein [Desulfobulbus sp.]
MQRFQNILYASTGVSPDTEGLHQALLLARQHQAALQCLVVSPKLPARLQPYQDPFTRFLRTHVEQALETAGRSLPSGPSADKVPITVRAGSGSSAVSVIRHVLREKNDLLIKETDPTPAGSIAEIDQTLLRKCPCPLWLARPLRHPWSELRIAAAVDPGYREQVKEDLAVRILRVAAGLAGLNETSFDVVSCWDFEFDQYVHSKTRIPAAAAATIVNAQTAHSQEMERLIETAALSGPFRERRLRGRADTMIPLFADSQELDVLVMGAEGQGGLFGFLSERTAETILGAVQCSLLVLKPEDYLSPVRL